MPIALGELDLDEVLRYMGTPPSQAGPELRALAEECGRAVCAAARPRWAWRAFDIAEEADGVRLSCGLLLPGQDLKRHLRGCGRAAVFCATLSAQVDALIRRWESGDMLRALALDCSAAAAVEQSSRGTSPAAPSLSGTARGMGTCPWSSRTPCWTCWTPHGGWGCAPAPATSSPPASR